MLGRINMYQKFRVYTMKFLVRESSDTRLLLYTQSLELGVDIKSILIFGSTWDLKQTTQNKMV